MNRSTPARIAAFATSLLVTLALVDSIAGYAYAPPADRLVAFAQVPVSH